MTHTIDTETVDTIAGTYRIEFVYDESAHQPFDEDANVHVAGGRWDTGTDAGDPMPALVANAIATHAHRDDHWYWELRSGAAIVRYMRLLGYHGVTLVTDRYPSDVPTANRTDRVYGIAWAPNDAADPDAYTRGTLDEWHAWAEGDTFGYRVLDPSGDEIDSCWGYYGYSREYDYVMNEARSAVDYDVDQRTAAAGLVGAGFVGIV